MATYIVSSGDVSSGIILNNGDGLTILESGTANSTTVNSYGRLYVSGGMANSTMVNLRGFLYVSSGGIANDTTVNSGGWVRVYEGGTANSTTVNLGGKLSVGSEPQVIVFAINPSNSEFINSSGNLTVSHGWGAQGIVENGGYVFVADEADVSFASNTFIGLILSNANESATVHSGTTAVSTTIKNSGNLHVCGGEANSTTINEYGTLYISSGGTANNTTVNSAGNLYVYSGGTATSIVINSNGYLCVYSGGTASIVFNPWRGGSLQSNTGAVVTYLDPDAGVYYGNRNQGLVSKSDIIESLSIESGLSVIVFSGGTANSATINSGGTLYISSGGTANNLIASNGASVSFDVTPDTYVKGSYDGSAFEMKNASISGYAVNSWCSITVSSGGMANATTVNTLGELNCYFGGTADNTTINSYGSLTVYGGGKANNTTIVGEFGSMFVYGEAKNTTVNAFGFLYVSSGGTADTTVFNGYAMDVSSGGTANSTTVNDGTLNISSGGVANSTTVNSGGRLCVFDGTANSTILSSGAQAFIYSGGTADNTIIDQQGNLTVYGDGKACNTTIDSWGNMFVDSGGRVTNNTVNSGGRLEVNFGGTAKSTYANSGGSMFISSGGTATEVKENGGYVWLEDGAKATFVATTHSGLDLDWSMTAHSGTTAVSTTISSNGKLHVCGGTANNTVVTGSGYYYVSSGGTAQQTEVASGGAFVIYSGGIAESTTVSNGGNLYANGGSVNDTIVYSGGNLWISSGGTAQQTVIESGVLRVSDGGYASGVILRASSDRNQGDIYVSAGGVVEDVQVEQYGDCYVSSGGALNNATINAGGHLRVENSGTATAIKENGGYIDVQNGAEIAFAANTFSGVELINASATAHSGTRASKTMVGSNSYLYMYEGGSATETVVDSGYFYVLSDGTATKTTVNSNGQLQISSGGVATSTMVNSGGRFYVLSGATATEVAAVSGAYLEFNVTSDTLITGTSGGSAFTIKAGVVNDGYTLETARLELGTGVQAKGITANSCGRLYVSSGATATSIQENGGGVDVEDGAEVSFIKNTFSNFVLYNASATVHSGTTANNTIVSSGGRIRVYSGGIADGVDINGGGFLYISSGGTATTIKENGGYVSAADGANVTFVSANMKGLTLQDSASIHSNTKMTSTTVSWGGLAVFSGGTADTTVLLDGRTTVFSGGIANNTIVYSRARLEVSSGGVANGVDIKSRGSATVSKGGTLRDLNISGGTLYLDGGKLSGKVMIEGGAYVRVYGSSTLDFDISGITPDAEARVNDLSLISGGSIQYTLTVGAQKSGSYALAEGALRFNSSITVLNTDGVQLGTLTAGNSLTTERATYTLVSFGESLSVDVESFAPAAPTASADTTSTTTQAVTVTAVFDEDCTIREYSYDEKDWLAYMEPIVFTENGTVYFRGADAAGNFSEITSYEVKNIEPVSPDTTAPSDPTGLRAFIERQDVALVWNVSTDDLSGVKEYVVTYSFNGQDFTVRTSGTSYVLNNADLGSYSWSVQAVDFAGNESAIIAGDTFTVSGFKPYTVEYSADNFEHVITFAVMTPSLDAFRIPGGTYQLRVRQEGSSEWLTGDPIVAEDTGDAPQLVKSDADGNADVFFANSIGTWKSGYLAQHVGSTADTWGGTREYASLYGKNKLADIIEGSTDANILLMTDDENGDALFVDDIYSDSPDELGLSQSRIAQIDEIRAGAGADIVDMTSQRFEYIGEGLTIRGGAGNDTIWANKGDNWLFGDAGNDRIVGASGNDVIVGGIGNDRMHGGGGNDVFTFCDNWGADNVEQLATGSVTLWFASGSMENWNDGTLTYTDGENSVTVSGVTADKVTLKFGDDGSAQFATLSGMGAFFDATSERIFEESGKGILASL